MCSLGLTPRGRISINRQVFHQHQSIKLDYHVLIIVTQIKNIQDHILFIGLTPLNFKHDTAIGQSVVLFSK